MKRLLLIPGDGIGKEVMAAGIDLLSVIQKKFSFRFQTEMVDWGAERWLKENVGIPLGVLETLPGNFDAILFGALGDKRIPDMAHGRAILLGLRFGLDLYVNMRPLRLLNPRLCPLKVKEKGAIDIVIFRENTEDIYCGLGEVVHRGTADEIALDISRHTFLGVSRIVRAAFDYAKKQGRKKVTLVDKSNAIKFGGDLWQRTYAQVRKEYREIEADHLFVDVAAMQMVENPQRFDVVVTSNMFGDILSDLGGALVGGLGLLASANIHPGGIALFEPVHGSAPDIAGENLANPFAMFLSIAMMMEYFGRQDIAKRIEQTIALAIEQGATTKDLKGNLNCSDAGNFIFEALG